MRKWTKGVIAGAVLLSLGVIAAPNADLSWTAPTNYEDGTIITNDPLLYKLYCSDTQGGPYSYVTDLGTDVTSAAQVDVGSCVNGVPGTYYFVATATSTVYNEESVFSNELVRLYSASDLGKVPLSPTLLSVN